MTRRHRRLHRAVWIGLAFAVGLGFVLALALRPPPENERRADRQELAR